MRHTTETLHADYCPPSSCQVIFGVIAGLAALIGAGASIAQASKKGPQIPTADPALIAAQTENIKLSNELTELSLEDRAKQNEFNTDLRAQAKFALGEARPFTNPAAFQPQSTTTVSKFIPFIAIAVILLIGSR